MQFFARSAGHAARLRWLLVRSDSGYDRSPRGSATDRFKLAQLRSGSGETARKCALSKIDAYVAVAMPRPDARSRSKHMIPRARRT